MCTIIVVVVVVVVVYMCVCVCMSKTVYSGKLKDSQVFVHVYITSCRPHTHTGSALHQLAEEVVELLKEQCGKEVFSTAHTAVHQHTAAVRTRRRAEKAFRVSLFINTIFS